MNYLLHGSGNKALRHLSTGRCGSLIHTHVLFWAAYGQPGIDVERKFHVRAFPPPPIPSACPSPSPSTSPSPSPSLSSSLWTRNFLRQMTSGAAAEEEVSGLEDHRGKLQYLDFPGARVAFTPQLEFSAPQPVQPISCLRVMDEMGRLVDASHDVKLDKALAVRMYQQMVLLQTLDVVFFEAQRQGRFSFYMTTAGEEAVNIASAAALSPEDVVFAQYREPGVLLWRGFSLEEFADQCLGNVDGHGKGRQMPVHYGSAALNFHTVSSPLATQIPHAVGAAYSLKHLSSNACAVAYFGEGAASEGDFHGAINFAAVLQAPVIFICRNNGWAISTPAHEQYRGDGIAGRAQAYGIRGLRVDGNDALALYEAISAARKVAVEEGQPVLVEAMTYRTGHHSTSDDSSRYRAAAEIQHWRAHRDPVARFRRWLKGQGWWTEGEETEARATARKEVLAALVAAEAKPKPPLSDLFLDVYDKPSTHLMEQEKEVREIVAKYPDAFPKDIPL